MTLESIPTYPDAGRHWQIVDDVINVSGHRMRTAEVESALVAHEALADPAVVDKLIEGHKELSG